MTTWRKQTVYLIWAGVVVGLGLASRRYGAQLPPLIAQYAGDTLWALLVFLLCGVVAPMASTARRAALALVLAYSIELSQLYHAPWIESMRSTRIGGLVLGYGFLWSDIACYTVGIGAGAALELATGGARRAGARAEGDANPASPGSESQSG